MPNHLIELTLPKYRREFILVHLNALTEAMILGRLKGTPYSERDYSCGSNRVYSVDDIIFDCPIFSDQRAKLISLLVN